MSLDHDQVGDASVTSGPVRPGGTHRFGPRPLATVVLSWLAMIGVDLFLHAGLLAPLYDWDSPFLLRPDEAFVRIPIGYLAFLLLAIGLAWLLTRHEVERGRDGALVGAALGAVAWGALVIGLWSISTADPALLVGWWVGQTVELAVGGHVIGSVLGGVRLRTVAGWVGLVLAVGAVSAVVLQTIGYATAPIIVR
jgi:hypothetical protein